MVMPRAPAFPGIVVADLRKKNYRWRCASAVRLLPALRNGRLRGVLVFSGDVKLLIYDLYSILIVHVLKPKHWE